MFFLQSNLLQTSSTDFPKIPADSVFVKKITEDIDKLTQMSPKEIGEWFLEGVVNLGLKIFGALILFVVARWLIKRIDKLVNKIFVERNVDPSVNSFVRNILKVVNYTIVLMIVVHILGITTSWFMAFLAAAGFAVGMALSGTLQNFAGGVMILIMKPFHLGDYISMQGQEGTVKEIKLFSTILNTGDNQRIIIPNGGITSNIINNVSSEWTRRVEWVFSIRYGADFDKAKTILTRFLDEDKRVIKDSAAQAYSINIKAVNTSTIDIVVRAWVKRGDYWNVFYSINESVYQTFPIEDLGTAIQRMDVKLLDQPDTPQANTE